jgi:hypothetical protein
MWWFASATFAVLVIITLLQRIPEGSHEVCKAVKVHNHLKEAGGVHLIADCFWRKSILCRTLMYMLAHVVWGRQVHKNLTFLTVVAVAIYGVLWLLGSEGTASLGLSQEVPLPLLDLGQALVLFQFLDPQWETE